MQLQVQRTSLFQTLIENCPILQPLKFATVVWCLLIIYRVLSGKSLSQKQRRKKENHETREEREKTTCRHSSGSVLLTDQCIHVLPFKSLSMPSASSTIKFGELLSNSKCLMWSSRHAHMHGVRPSLSRMLTSALCWIKYCNRKLTTIHEWKDIQRQCLSDISM